MDKMREEFEAWAMSCDMCTYFDDVEYRHQSTEWAWRAWKASRSALCVEFPDFSKHEDGGEWWAGYTCAVSDVKSSLNQIGVTCK